MRYTSHMANSTATQRSARAAQGATQRVARPIARKQRLDVTQGGFSPCTFRSVRDEHMARLRALAGADYATVEWVLDSVLGRGLDAYEAERDGA